MPETEGTIEREMVAIVRGVTVEDLDDGSFYGRYSNDVDQAIDKRKVVVEDELLAQTDLGRQVLKLRPAREPLGRDLAGDREPDILPSVVSWFSVPIRLVQLWQSKRVANLGQTGKWGRLEFAIRSSCFWDVPSWLYVNRFRKFGGLVREQNRRVLRTPANAPMGIVGCDAQGCTLWQGGTNPSVMVEVVRRSPWAFIDSNVNSSRKGNANLRTTAQRSQRGEMDTAIGCAAARGERDQRQV